MQESISLGGLRDDVVFGCRPGFWVQTWGRRGKLHSAALICHQQTLCKKKATFTEEKKGGASLISTPKTVKNK